MQNKNPISRPDPQACMMITFLSLKFPKIIVKFMMK